MTRAFTGATRLCLVFAVLLVTVTTFGSVACSSSSVASTPDASSADSGGSADAGITVKILKPVDNSKYATTDKVPVSGTATAVGEGLVTDPARLAWNLVDPAGIINPEGEGADDLIGPFDAGTYKIQFIAKSLTDAMASETVTIVVQ